MTVKQAYNRKPTIDITFITDNNTFNLRYNTNEEKTDNNNVLNKGNLSASIISFTTTNDMNDDSGTFNLNAAGSERFDRILSPNDIIIIKVHPGMPRVVKNDVIMVGMISGVKRIGQYDSSTVVYQITGNSMMKALMQLKLGTIQDVASMLGTTGWMIGMGGMQSADSYLDGSASDDETGGGKSVDALKKESDGKKSGVFVSAFQASKFFKGAKDDDLIVATNTDYPIGSYIFVEGYGVARVAYHLGKDKETMALVSRNTVLGKAPTVFVNLPPTKVKAFGNQLNETVYTFKKKPDTSAPVNTDGSVSVPGSQGLAFAGKKASEVTEQILNWFLKAHTKYFYENGQKNLTDFMEWHLSSWPDEYLMDVTPLMSYEGSLRQFITDTQAKPYNEFYADYTKDGKMDMIMRRTPFEPGDWNNLYGEGVELLSTDVVEETTGTSNSETYSIFISTMPSNVMVDNLSKLLSFPVYFPDLADRYGYSMLQVNNPYIFMFSQGSNAGGSSDASTATGGGKAITTADIDDIANATMAWTSKGSDNVTAAHLDAFIKKSNPTARLNGTGKHFIEAGNKTGLNPVILLGFAANESAWGNSAIGQSHNYFGIGAFDTNPDNGFKYSNSSDREGIINGATFIQHDYFNQGQTTLHSLFNNNGVHQYSTTKTEDRIIAGIAAAYYAMFPMSSKKSDVTDTKQKDTANTKNSGKEDADTNNNASRLKKYSVMLANWYGDNPSFVSGEIRVLGNPDYRVGKVLIRKDNGTAKSRSNTPVQMDYYIEAVTHEFNLTSGYTTTLGVTRGLPHSVDRFRHWNSWLDPLTPEMPGNGKLQFFNGGLFGEMSLKNSITKASEKNGSNGNGEGNQSGGSNDTTGVGKGDDYPAQWRNVAPDSVADSWGYLNTECVSFVGFRLSQMGKTGFTGLGNAIQWPANSGLKGQSKPQIGDVAWFNAVQAPGAYGHVAYVAGVNGDDIYLEEYNYGTQYAHKYHTRVVKKSAVSAFLRFPNK